MCPTLFILNKYYLLKKTVSILRDKINSLLFLFLMVVATSSAHGVEEDISFSSNQQSIDWLIKGSYKQKKIAIEAIANTAGEKSITLLNGLLTSTIFYKKQSHELYEILPFDEQYSISQIQPSLELSSPVIADGKSEYKKIRINNSIRSLIRISMAKIELKNSDPIVREIAVRSLYKNLNTSSINSLLEAKKSEKNSSVIEALEIAISAFNMSSELPELLRQSIYVLSDSLEPIALNKLTQFYDQTDHKELKALAKQGIDKIEDRLGLFSKLETLYFGLSMGSVLVLAGIGLAITFGVMGVINMAHGELIMIGAYTTFVVQKLMPNHIGLSIIVAIPAAFIVSGLVGVVMERLVVRHLYGRPLETLLATFGISLILQQAIRTIFSPLNQTVITPDWMSGVLQINSIFSLTWNRLYIIGFSLIVFFMLLAFMKKSVLGLHVRAVSQNRAMARAMGVRSTHVDILTFGLGSGIAGIAGVALSLLTNVGPNLGQTYIIDSFIVVVFGGVGNLLGTLTAGMSLGIVNKILEPWAGAVLAKILVLIFIILFIQKRPQGLFPQRGRAVEN